MKICIICFGNKPRPFESAWIDEYIKRIRKYGSFELIRLKEMANDSWTAIEKKIPKNSWTILLDPNGKSTSTDTWVRFFDRIEMSGRPTVTLIIGGAYGLPPEAKKSADQIWKLSDLTLPHRLALLICTEQIYRVISYRSGSPYHH